MRVDGVHVEVDCDASILEPPCLEQPLCWGNLETVLLSGSLEQGCTIRYDAMRCDAFQCVTAGRGRTGQDA